MSKTTHCLDLTFLNNWTTNNAWTQSVDIVTWRQHSLHEYKWSQKTNLLIFQNQCLLQTFHEILLSNENGHEIAPRNKWRSSNA